jgi:hypothetical protein
VKEFAMSVKLIAVEGDTVRIELDIKLSRSMLESEETILNALNEAGCLATGEALKRFDTDGSAIVIGGIKWTSKGEEPKYYQTPYGEVEVMRHVYQTSAGGKTFCPLERDARIVVTSTPRFAKVVSHKFAGGGSTQVESDLAENHGRRVARSYLQNLAEAVGSIVQAKEESWHYATPRLTVPVHTVAIGLDGTCMLLCEEGYRQAMVGTLSLYDRHGERLHTVYVGATPEYGQAAFMERMEREIAHVKQLYPKAVYVGIADGAQSNWEFLEAHTSVQILDFYHATGYLAEVAQVAYPRSVLKRTEWLERRCHELKHTPGAAALLVEEMQELADHPLSESLQEKLQRAITYFSNHQHQMEYANYRAHHFPIGSGVTEAACKTLVKQRLCYSGMRWKEKGASMVLSLRALVLTHTRWDQFWGKIDQYGFPIAA